jgi:hypothetical protein
MISVLVTTFVLSKGYIFPVLNYALRHENVLRSGGVATLISNVVTRWYGQWASRHGRITSEEGPGTHSIGDRKVFTAVMDPCQKPNSDQIVQGVA